MPKLGKVVEYVYRPGAGAYALWSWLVAVARLGRDLALRRVSTLYLVCSRSDAGFLRDVPALLAARLGARVIIHAHGSDIVDLLTASQFSPLARWLYRPATLILPSSHLFPPLAKLGFARIVTVENYGLTIVKKVSQSPSTLTLLWNSNVMASKGAFDTLRAAAELQANGVALRVHVLGSVLGDKEMQTDEAAACFEYLKRSVKLTYHGWVDAESSAELLASADVVALPSRCECQPLSVVEAMCAGKALIVSDIASLRATIGDYPAELVTAHSVSAIKHALMCLHDEKLSDPAAFLARRAACAAAARARFAAERFDAEMLTLFADSSAVDGVPR